MPHLNWLVRLTVTQSAAGQSKRISRRWSRQFEVLVGFDT
jgi:hypothetical protein